MATDLHHERLYAAALDLSSYAFHQRAAKQNRCIRISEDYTYLRYQYLQFDRGVKILSEIVAKMPVVLAAGTEPIRFHDPTIWPYESDEEWLDIFDDDLSAARMYYAKTRSLEPGEELVLNVQTQFLAPGDSTSNIYFGDVHIKPAVYIMAGDLALALENGARISLI